MEEINFTLFRLSKNFGSKIFRSLPHLLSLLSLILSQTMMHRLKPKFSSFRKQCQQQQSKRKDGDSGFSTQEPLNPAARRPIIRKLSIIKEEIPCSSEDESNQSTIGSVNYYDRLGESDERSNASGNEHKLLSDSRASTIGSGNLRDRFNGSDEGSIASTNNNNILSDSDNRSSQSIKRGPPSVCVKIGNDNPKAESMVDSSNVKKMKKTPCHFSFTESMEFDHKTFGSVQHKNTILEVDEDQSSRRKRMNPSEAIDSTLGSPFSSLSRPDNLASSKVRSSSDGSSSIKSVLTSDRENSEKSNSNNRRRNNRISMSKSACQLSRGDTSLRMGEDGNNDGASVSSSCEEYLQILGAAQELDNMGNALFKCGNYEQALTSYSKALRVKRKTLECGLQLNATNKKDLTDRLLASVATSINNIGYLLQRSGVPMCEVMAAYKDSLQIKQEILGDKHLSVGKTLNNIGSVYFKNHDNHDALEAYEQARKIMVDNLGPSHLDVATVYSNIGDVYLSTHKLELARQNYRASLNIRWSQLGHAHSKVVRLLEKIAAIEMAGTPEKLKQQKASDRVNDHSYDHRDRVNDLRELGEGIKGDLSYVEKLSRKMALDMIRDRIKMIREMRRLEEGEDEIVLNKNTNNSNDDCCSTKSSIDSESDSSLILHGSKDALTILTESITREEQHSHASFHAMEAYISSKSSSIGPPPAVIRTVSNDFGAQFDEASVELFTEDRAPD